MGTGGTKATLRRLRLRLPQVYTSVYPGIPPAIGLALERTEGRPMPSTLAECRQLDGAELDACLIRSSGLKNWREFRQAVSDMSDDELEELSAVYAEKLGVEDELYPVEEPEWR